MRVKGEPRYMGLALERLPFRTEGLKLRTGRPSANRVPPLGALRLSVRAM